MDVKHHVYGTVFISFTCRIPIVAENTTVIMKPTGLPSKNSNLHLLSVLSLCLYFFFPGRCTTGKQTAVKSKETVGNSWTVLKVFLGHKSHHYH